MNKIYGSQNQFNDIWNDFDYPTYRDGEEKDLQKLIDKLKTFLRKGKK